MPVLPAAANSSIRIAKGKSIYCISTRTCASYRYVRRTGKAPKENGRQLENKVRTRLSLRLKHRAIPEINQFTSGGIIAAPMSQAERSRRFIANCRSSGEKKKSRQLRTSGFRESARCERLNRRSSSRSFFLHLRSAIVGDSPRRDREALRSRARAPRATTGKIDYCAT